MQTSNFFYELPPELIAQAPVAQRDQSRLLVLHRASGKIEHRRFRDLRQYLRGGDVLVLNNSRVIPARLRGANAQTGGHFEVLLLEETQTNEWWSMLRPAKRARVGARIIFQDTHGRSSHIQAVVLATNEEGHRRLRFTGSPNIAELLDELGEAPLPPYIQRLDGRPTEQDRERYQTVFAHSPGSIAAPTAGLHFTGPLLDEIRSQGVRVCFLTLHVGLGTFAPVKAQSLAAHTMHEERFEVSEETARCINQAKWGRPRAHSPATQPEMLGANASKPGRVIAVGTTTIRVLESVAAQHQGRLVAGAGKTRIFLYPPSDFKIADALLTNFHLPRSTLLMLISAFAAPNETRGRDLILSAYAEAIRARYRFFSYGDAMLLL